jgi:cell wall-associated NlpC family hydrolase
MQHARPRLLSRRRVERLLSKTKSFDSAGCRIEVLSRQFLGQPYQINPMIGSAETPETFVASLDTFDCVTYVETVLALSLAATPDQFTEWLRKIRYEGGRIAWKRRNHYMTGWIRSNVRAGAVHRLALPNVPIVVKNRTLNGVPGLPASRVRFTCVPKPAIGRLMQRLETGDLIFFASTRKHLDVFHCGIIVRDHNRVLVRHASRSRGGVVEQDLNDFLKANRMAGVIVARPKDQRGQPPRPVPHRRGDEGAAPTERLS